MDQELTKTVEISPNANQANIPPQPEFIGPYKIESLLKKGGMSLLYLGIDPKNSQTVVVKVLLPKYLKNKELLNRLLREGKILSMAFHPNIVKLYDLGRSEQGLYIAMEYVQGVSLRQFIKKESLTHKRALEIVLETAYALAHLHGLGILHRDLKPDNILITESGGVKIIDFGISEFVETEDAYHKTQKKSRMGTPHYMSPEQQDEPQKVSYGTDIFSLGIIAYELYLGHPAHGILQPALLPRKLSKIISKAVELDPAKRYADIVDFIADLTVFLQHIDDEEKKASPEDLYRMLEITRDRLLTREAPRWTNIEVGIRVEEGSEIGSYLDFLPLIPNRYAVIIAKPIETGLNALFLSSMLQGMLRMAVQMAPSEPVPYFLDLLNRSLFLKEESRFNFSLLFLDVEHSLLAFASSSQGVFCHLPESGSSFRYLDVENPPLGEKREAVFLEIKENWNPGDLLLLSSFSMESAKVEPFSKELIVDTKILAGKALDLLKKPKDEGILVALRRL